MIEEPQRFIGLPFYGFSPFMNKLNKPETALYAPIRPRRRPDGGAAFMKRQAKTSAALISCGRSQAAAKAFISAAAAAAAWAFVCLLKGSYKAIKAYFLILF